MAFYIEKWIQKNIVIPSGIRPSSLVHTAEAATILSCSSRTLERYRQQGIGPAHEPINRYIGNPRYYLVWKLIVWRSKLIGYGPETKGEVWEWFMKQQVQGKARKNPKLRPNWWPRGIRGKQAKSRKLSQIMIKYWEIETKYLDREFYSEDN